MKKSVQNDFDLEMINLDETAGWSQLEVEAALNEQTTAKDNVFQGEITYEEEFYDGQKVSVSRIITSPDYSIVPMEYFEIYCMNHEIDKMQFILKLDAYSYYMMNIMEQS